MGKGGVVVGGAGVGGGGGRGVDFPFVCLVSHVFVTQLMLVIFSLDDDSLVF